MGTKRGVQAWAQSPGVHNLFKKTGRHLTLLRLIIRVCVCVCVCVCVRLLQLCLTLCNRVNCSPPTSSVHGILQVRILEWVAILSSRGSSQPRDRTPIFYISCISTWVLYHEHHLGNPQDRLYLLSFTIADCFADVICFQFFI